MMENPYPQTKHPPKELPCHICDSLHKAWEEGYRSREDEVNDLRKTLRSAWNEDIEVSWATHQQIEKALKEGMKYICDTAGECDNQKCPWKLPSRLLVAGDRWVCQHIRLPVRSREYSLDGVLFPNGKEK